MLSRFIIATVVLSFFGLTSCDITENSNPVSLTSIAELSSQLTLPDETIYVEGKVIDRVPLLDRGAYELQDASGQVWVVTTNPLPERGQTVTIEAKIQTKSISLHNESSVELYLLQLRQLQ